MVNVKTSLKKFEEEFVPVQVSTRLIPGRHLLGISMIIAMSVVMIIPSQVFINEHSTSYLSALTASEAQFLAQDESEVIENIIYNDDTQIDVENYEDYDIPKAMFDNITVEDSVITVTTVPADEGKPAPADAKGSQQPLEIRPVGTWYLQTVSKGDTLSKIFAYLNLPNTTLKKITSIANRNDLNLTIGSKVHFLIDNNNVVKEFVNPLTDKEQVRFTRLTAKDNFKVIREPINAHVQDPALIARFEEANNMPFVRERELRAERDRQLMLAKQKDEEKMTVNNTRPRLIVFNLQKGTNFKTQAKTKGLTPTEIRRIDTEIRGRINLSKLPDNYTFRILYNGIGTRALINAFEFKGTDKTKEVALYRNPLDNNFYEENKYKPTAGVFRRFPLANTIIINSKFNPRRKHPVTGRITPHNGIDFKARVGTPIYAPADGVVTYRGYQRLAGYYIIIKHEGSFSTVYMHLSRMEVAKGQKVHVGQMIAKTGNTGRTTGPHLHYEIRINDRPVDPLYIDLPSNSNPARVSSQIKAFKDNVKNYKSDLYKESLAMVVPEEDGQGKAKN